MLNALSTNSLSKPILIFAYGNPSRGDDALGPQLLEQLENKLSNTDLADKVELLTDFQLQIEHSLDLENRQHIVFVDASLNTESAFSFQPLRAEKDHSYSSHAMSPSALLNLHQQLSPDTQCNAYLLAIRGYDFELGKRLSSQAATNLHQSLNYIYNWLIKLS